MPAADVIQPSASVASVGLGLRYIGKDHCYAFSGLFGAKNTVQTLFDFTTGSGYIVATLTLAAPINFSTGGIVSGYYRGFHLTFNSESIGLYKVDSQEEDMPSNTEVQILIPPFTVVVLTCIDSGTNAAYNGTVHLTGRVYGAE